MVIWRVTLAALLTAALSLFAINAPRAQFNCATAGFCSPTPTGGFTPSCTQSATAITALVVADPSLITADKSRYDTMICGLVTLGLWNFDVFYMWDAPTAAAALVNLANPGTYNGTVNGSCTFTAYQGYTGDGSSCYIDSGFNPSTAPSPNYVQNSANVGVYIAGNRTTQQFAWNVGCSTGSCSIGPIFSAILTGGNTTTNLNSSSNVSGGAATAAGAWNSSRNDATDVAIFLNSGIGPAFSIGPAASSPPDNVNVIFFALLATFGWSSDQMAAGWIGKGLFFDDITQGGTDSCNVNNTINTYLGSLTVPQNVYTNSPC